MKKVETTKSMKNYKRLTFGEEVANAVSHGVMVIFLLFSFPFISVKAYLDGGLKLLIGDSIFIIALLFMFLGSTLYHAMENDSQAKYIFRILDHSFIFVAIAGTYTPIALMILDGWRGIAIIAIQWTMVILGILQKTVIKKELPKISLAIYLVMGWIAVLILPELLKTSTPLFLGLIVLGGIFYSIGVAFYVQKNKKYFHFIWHIFIILASLCHIAAIVFYMI